MQIFWHGFSSIRIETTNAGTKSTLVTDPYANDTGLRFPRTLEPDLVVLSHQDQSRFALDAFTNTPFLIADPGEYEKAGVFVRGIQPVASKSVEGEDEVKEEKVKKDVPADRAIVYRLRAEDMVIAFLGQLDRSLTGEEVEALGNVDILMVPVGGGSVLDTKKAQSAVESIEPRLIIPMYYDVKGVKEKLASVDAFCKELGSVPREDVSKLKLSKKDLPQDSMKICVIERA